jgi:HEAT repeat protein
LIALRELGAKSYSNRDVLSRALLEDSDAEVRRCAAETFGKFSYSWGLGALRAALDDTDVEVRRLACHSLTKYRSNDENTMQKLWHLMNNDVPDVRTYAAEAFASSPTSAYADKYIAALQEERARSSAAKALGKLREWKAVNHLCNALMIELQRDYPFAVECIVQALVDIGDQKAVPRLIKAMQFLLNKRECHANSAIAQALGDFADPSALPMLRETAEKHQCCASYTIVPVIERIEALNK